MTCANCNTENPYLMGLVAGAIEGAVHKGLDLDDVTTLVNFLYSLASKAYDYGKENGE